MMVVAVTAVTNVVEIRDRTIIDIVATINIKSTTIDIALSVVLEKKKLIQYVTILLHCFYERFY